MSRWIVLLVLAALPAQANASDTAWVIDSGSPTVPPATPTDSGVETLSDTGASSDTAASSDTGNSFVFVTMSDTATVTGPGTGFTASEIAGQRDGVVACSEGCSNASAPVAFLPALVAMALVARRGRGQGMV